MDFWSWLPRNALKKSRPLFDFFLQAGTVYFLDTTRLLISVRLAWGLGLSWRMWSYWGFNRKMR